MPEYLLSTHSVEGEAGEPMSDDEMQAFMTRIAALEGEMSEAGALVYSGRLSDAAEAKVVRVKDRKVATTDGPFAETKEHLGGFYIVRAADMDEALSWGSKTAECIGRPIEVRPFFATRGG